MGFKSFLGLLMVCCIIEGCGSMERAVAMVPDSAPEVVINPGFKSGTPTDRVSITFAEQRGDYLALDVSYSGGCGEHDFQLVTKGKYTSTYPPEINVTLVHDNNGDGCRSMIDEKRFFDLRPLQYQGTNKVILVITNTNKTLEYTY